MSTKATRMKMKKTRMRRTRVRIRGENYKENEDEGHQGGRRTPMMTTMTTKNINR